MSGHFLHLWTLCQKNAPQIFERRPSCKNIGPNVKNSCFWASCIAPTLNLNLIIFQPEKNWQLQKKEGKVPDAFYNTCLIFFYLLLPPLKNASRIHNKLQNIVEKMNEFLNKDMHLFNKGEAIPIFFLHQI